MVIKMKDLIKAQTDELRKKLKNIHPMNIDGKVTLKMFKN